MKTEWNWSPELEAWAMSLLRKSPATDGYQPAASSSFYANRGKPQ